MGIDPRKAGDARQGEPDSYTCSGRSPRRLPGEVPQRRRRLRNETRPQRVDERDERRVSARRTSAGPTCVAGARRTSVAGIERPYRPVSKEIISIPFLRDRHVATSALFASREHIPRAIPRRAGALRRSPPHQSRDERIRRLATLETASTPFTAAIRPAAGATKKRIAEAAVPAAALFGLCLEQGSHRYVSTSGNPYASEMRVTISSPRQPSRAFNENRIAHHRHRRSIRQCSAPATKPASEASDCVLATRSDRRGSARGAGTT